MRIYRILAIFILLLGYCYASMDLNQARIAVVDRSQQALKAGLLEAYQQVMLKQSGNPAVMTVPQVQNSRVNFQDFVVHYRYVDQDDGLVLQVTFDEQALRRVLANAGQTVWGQHRPVTLVVFPDNQLAKSLDQNAERYGLRILFPTMDLQDQTERDNPDVMVKRYQVDSVVYGMPDGQSIRWRWWCNSQSQQWVSSGETISIAVQRGMERLLEILASHYATLASQNLQSDVLLSVDRISGLKSYTDLMHALQTLSVTRSVTVKAMDANSMLLEVSVAGGSEVLMAALQKNPHLMFYRFDDESKSSIVLRYRWQ